MTDLDKRADQAKPADKPQDAPHCELALWQRVADCAHERCRQAGRCVAEESGR
jgi:hypothetical protein